MAEKKFYVVWTGVKPGIYTSWAECKAMVENFPNAKYKGYKTITEAKQALASGLPNNFYASKNGPKKKAAPKGNTPIIESLSVDAACSGNPGVMEYRGVHVGTKEIWFHQKFELGTNNIGEFLALVHGLAELKRRNLNIPIYSDSVTALAWLRNKHCKTQLGETEKTQLLFDLIDRAEQWLKINTYPNAILKWETEIWGEIPADFGRK
ncbi:MAG: ribonuclease H family protein [Breznakibacter sp.]